MKTTILILITCFILIACEKNDAPIISEDPILLEELANSSSDTIEIGLNKLILDTYLYRDFMPSIPSSKKNPLIASLTIIDIDSVPISNDLDISKLYVIKENSIWISVPKNLTQSDTSRFKLKRVSVNGPEWETKIYVDVVIEITLNSSNKKYLLIAKNQYIDKTY